MSTNTFGENFRVTTFGESHGPAMGVVIDGIRPGIEVDLDDIQAALDRRRPGTSRLTSPRKEADRLEVLSGLFEGRTTGAPIAIIVRNEDAKPGHYEEIKDVFRPGHADYTWWHKFGIRDWRGGGRTSGRETVSRVAAGALAQQILAREGVTVTGHVVRVGDVVARTFDPEVLAGSEVRCADPEAGEAMKEVIESARKAGDSVGGVVEVRAGGVPAGWGDPVFMKLDANLAAGLMSIGAVKGVEIGDGFALAGRLGSESNDSLSPGGFVSNHMGGILGGISNGEPVVARAAVKPTSSIRHEQQTVDADGNPRTIRVKGRHDPCICIRVVPVAEAMMSLILCDAFLRQQAMVGGTERDEHRRAEMAFCDAEIVRLVDRRRRLRAHLGGAAREAGEKALRALQIETGTRAGLDEAYLERLFGVVGAADDPLPGDAPPDDTVPTRGGGESP